MPKPNRFITLLLLIPLLGCRSQKNQPSPTHQPGDGTMPAASSISATPDLATAQPTVQAENPKVPAATGCTAASPRPTPGPTEDSMFPPVSGHDWMRGAPDGYLTIIEYSDFQCPNCSQLEPILSRLLEEFPDDLRLAFRHYPLIAIHDKAALAAQAAEAAGLQDKFWEFHDLLFAKQSEWVDLSEEEFRTWLSGQAQVLTLDRDQFNRDLDDPQIAARIQSAWTHNLSIGMPGTPFLLLNGQIWPDSLPLNYATLTDYVRLNLLAKRQFATCPPMEINPTHQYEASVHTEKGDFTIQLYADKAPLTVNNFVFLARQGWYDQVPFHRVLPGYIAQAGDPSGTGYGGPGYTFINENSAGLTFDEAGLVAMANSGRDTNGSQFFITYIPTPKLNGNYTIFGKVTQGMDVVEKLSPRDPASGANLPPGDLILSISIKEY